MTSDSWENSGKDWNSTQLSHITGYTVIEIFDTTILRGWHLQRLSYYHRFALSSFNLNWATTHRCSKLQMLNNITSSYDIQIISWLNSMTFWIPRNSRIAMTYKYNILNKQHDIQVDQVLLIHSLGYWASLTLLCGSAKERLSSWWLIVQQLNCMPNSWLKPLLKKCLCWTQAFGNYPTDIWT